MHFENLNITLVSVAILIMILLVIKFGQTKISFLKNNKANLVFLFISLLLLTIALMKPYGSYKIINQKIKTSNILFLLDVSKSMNTLDIREKNLITTRLNLAKAAIEKIITTFPRYNYSLIIFAKEAITVMPFTNDLNIFLSFLKNVNYKNLTQQ
jgi:hypothetical protein